MDNLGREIGRKAGPGRTFASGDLRPVNLALAAGVGRRGGFHRSPALFFSVLLVLAPFGAASSDQHASEIGVSPKTSKNKKKSALHTSVEPRRRVGKRSVHHLPSVSLNLRDLDQLLMNIWVQPTFLVAPNAFWSGRTPASEVHRFIDT